MKMNRFWKLALAVATIAVVAGSAFAQAPSAASNIAPAAATIAAPPAAAPAAATAAPTPPTAKDVNSGDNAWELISSALVLLMTVPALAFFYGGLVRRKNVLRACKGIT